MPAVELALTHRSKRPRGLGHGREIAVRPVPRWAVARRSALRRLRPTPRDGPPSPRCCGRRGWAGRRPTSAVTPSSTLRSAGPCQASPSYPRSRSSRIPQVLDLPITSVSLIPLQSPALRCPALAEFASLANATRLFWFINAARGRSVYDRCQLHRLAISLAVLHGGLEPQFQIVVSVSPVFSCSGMGTDPPRAATTYAFPAGSGDGLARGLLWSSYAPPRIMSGEFFGSTSATSISSFNVPVREERFPMQWTCPQCGAAVDASADRCWGCKQPRPEPEPGSRTVSEPVLKPDAEVAPANEVSDTAPVSGSCSPLSPPSEIFATRSWTCSKCGESVDAGFLVCWYCGTSIEGVEDPSFVRGDESKPGENGSRAISFLDDHDQYDLIEGPASRSCIRCRGPLEPGLIADFQRGSTVMKPSEWVAGISQPSFWTGTWTGDQRYPIQAFRCRHCGHLEFRAGGPEDDN